MTTTPIPRGLIDTPILIAYREGWPDPLQFITAVRLIGQPEFCAVSALALFAWCQDDADRRGVRVFLTGSIVHPVIAPISRRALRIMDQLPAPISLTPDDAIVAATALEHKLPLYTLDPSRFAGVAGLTTLQPY